MLYLPTSKASDLVLRTEGYNSNPHIPSFYWSARKFLFNENLREVGKICTSLAKLGTQTAIFYNKIYVACSTSLCMMHDTIKIKGRLKVELLMLAKYGHMSLPTVGNIYAAKIS